MKGINHWLLAIRPKTLGISLTPVLCGTGLASAETGAFHWLPALATLLSAMLIQVGTNLFNDAADFERGTDTPQRLGPPRAAAQGWFSAGQIKRAAGASFALATLVGSYLVWFAGWPLLFIGLVSILAGYAYTAGPWPIAYSASGEVFAFLFFGLAAVLGSYFVQAGDLSLNAFAVACAVGLLAAAVLLVNNYRDRDTDAGAGRFTLAHRLGSTGSQIVYAALLGLPFALPLLLSEVRGSWLIMLALPAALILVRRFSTWPVNRLFNRILVQTAGLQLAYGLLLTSGLLLW